MRPKKTRHSGSGDLFRARLDQIINMDHELVRLALRIDWEWIDEELADRFSDKGRPGTETRFMVGLLLPKHIYHLSDEGVCERWVHDPYFQYFTGEEFFRHAFRHERSGLMTHWRNRIGDKLDMLLQESLRVAYDTGALKGDNLARVTVDTTVQPRNVTHPTDARLMLKAINELGRLARRHGVALRQSPAQVRGRLCVRVAKRAALMARRYVHAKALPGNPYDGHTLTEGIAETQALTGREIERVYVDKGYRGHDAPKPRSVFLSGRRRGVHGVIKRELRRRSAIEAVIGHMKNDGHLGRNFLKGHRGDHTNAVLTAVGYNFRPILAWLRLLLRLILAILVENLGPTQSLKVAS